MKRIICLLCLQMSLLLAVNPANLPLSRVKYNNNGSICRGYSKEPIEINGYSCVRYIWFYPEGTLDNFEVADSTIINNIPIPARSKKFLTPDGVLDCVWFSRDVLVQGYFCPGGNCKEATGFHPNGQLRYVFPREPVEINGILCYPSGMTGVYFYPEGNLKSCYVYQDVDIQGKHYKKATQLQFSQLGEIIGSQRPSFFYRLFWWHIMYGLVKIIF
ncbi:MAG: hypothetical protein K8S56_01160 [Candidatus Cloacimonetes bacterium]|nr:hypothetical protein [Candidatus Cloacimonadota bacterium]